MKQIKYNFLNIVLRTAIFGLAYCVPFNQKTTNLGVSIYIKNDNMLLAHVQFYFAKNMYMFNAINW